MAVGPVAAAPDAISAVPAERVRAHKFRAANFATLKDVEGQQIRASSQVFAKKDVKLNLSKLNSELNTIFKDVTRGYAMQLRQNGNVIAQAQMAYARTPQDGNKSFTLDSRMHIASLSKLITSIATVKALTDRGLGFDQKIGAYLPAYWTQGQNVGDITFRRLLTHRTGFSVPPSADDGCGCSGDFQTMKKVVAAGVSNNPSRSYENVNFSILRIILPILTGAVSRTMASGADAAWDIQATQLFLEYVQDKVFTPSGVPNVSPIPNSSGALAYRSSDDPDGWDSGDLTTQLAGVGFRVSVKDVLDVMSTFRRKGTIVSQARAKEAIDAGLGLDWDQDTPAGKLWVKNGGWGTADGHVEHTVGFFLPDGMELVVFANSRLRGSADLTGEVRDAYVKSLEDSRPTAAAVAPPAAKALQLK